VANAASICVVVTAMHGSLVWRNGQIEDRNGMTGRGMDDRYHADSVRYANTAIERRLDLLIALIAIE